MDATLFTEPKIPHFEILQKLPDFGNHKSKVKIMLKQS